MANFFLQDSGANNWQLGVTTLGQITTTSTGAQTIVPLVLQDSSAQDWQLGVTTSGQVTTTSVAPTTLTTIILTDSSNGNWLLGVTTSGQLTATLLIYDEDFGFTNNWVSVAIASFDPPITVWQ